MTNEELKSLIKECIAEIRTESAAPEVTDVDKDIVEESAPEVTEVEGEVAVDEDTVLSEGIFSKKEKLPKCPITLDPKDALSASVFKKKTTEIIKFYKENGYTDKQISKLVFGWYYEIVIRTFDNKNNSNRTYEPKMVYLAGLLNKYAEKKYIDIIVKDINRTIKSLEKTAEKKELTSLQKAYLADIKKAIKVLEK